jgi:hypothetical protein
MSDSDDKKGSWEAYLEAKSKSDAATAAEMMRIHKERLLRNNPDAYVKHILEEKDDSDKKSSGGCFITRAIVESMGFSDDCRELRLMRKLRDTFMQETESRRAEVSKYYREALEIVNAIARHPRASEEWRRINDRWLLPIVRIAECGEVNGAFQAYRAMFHELQTMWGRPSPQNENLMYSSDQERALT